MHEVESTVKEQTEEFASAIEEQNDLLPTLISNVGRPWTKGVFYWSPVLRDSTDQSRLTQYFSHNYVFIMTRVTTG